MLVPMSHFVAPFEVNIECIFDFYFGTTLAVKDHLVQSNEKIKANV